MEIEEALRRIEKISLRVYYVFRICFYFLLAIVVLSFALAIVEFISPGMLPFDSQINWFVLFDIGIQQIPPLIIVRIVSNILADLSKGESPFTLKQVKRIRWIAVVFLIDVILGTVLSQGFVNVITAGAFEFAVMVGTDATTNYIPFNLGEAFFALILYCLSLAFEYGSLLQKFSDEAL